MYVTKKVKIIGAFILTPNYWLRTTGKKQTNLQVFKHKLQNQFFPWPNVKWTFNSIQYSIGVREITFTAWLSLGLKISPPYLHASMIKQRKVLPQARGSTKKKTKKIKILYERSWSDPEIRTHNQIKWHWSRTLFCKLALCMIIIEVLMGLTFWRFFYFLILLFEF